MRKLFSEYGLTMLTALVSAYIFNIFSKVIYSGGNPQMAQLIKSWVGRLT